MRPRSLCASCATGDNPFSPNLKGCVHTDSSVSCKCGRHRTQLMTSGLAILAIGFFLGMRPATDPDHVIAGSTIVSRERSVSKAAFLGVLWGLGHTLTILAVGAAIILFGLAIPARLGLTMEFCVGLMLVLLGVLNLTGAVKSISEKFSS